MKRKFFLKKILIAAAIIPAITESCSKQNNDNVNNPGTTRCGDPITPPVPEGPYYVDEMLNRSDIVENRTGVPLTLQFKVEDASCMPISGAIVDIWHCDKDGKYSDESSEGTLGQKWLRGLQATGADGTCTFKTIFPGWYNGRLTHIHGKVKVGSVTKQTTNFFIPKAIEQAVYSSPLYTKGQNPTTITQDVELRGDTISYNTLMMSVTGDITTGYTASFTIAYV